MHGLGIDVVDRFTPAILGLGDLGAKSASIEAICAMFDLAGFTDFARQVDPQLAVPEYLKSYIQWLFDSVKESCVIEKRETEWALYTKLPFFGKFMGDGVMFLWDASDFNDVIACNTPVLMDRICSAYVSEFLPSSQKQVTSSPPKLRCGVARGNVISVGNGEDFVGPCINVAARLQKLGPFTFAFSRRGFNLANTGKDWLTTYALVEVPVRGYRRQGAGVRPPFRSDCNAKTIGETLSCRSVTGAPNSS